MRRQCPVPWPPSQGEWVFPDHVARDGLREAPVASIKADAPPGIVAKGVEPGATASPDTAVDLLVNRGAADVAYVMPDVIGRDFDRVRLAFESRGFRLGGVKSQTY